MCDCVSPDPAQSRLTPSLRHQHNDIIPWIPLLLAPALFHAKTFGRRSGNPSHHSARQRIPSSRPAPVASHPARLHSLSEYAAESDAAINRGQIWGRFDDILQRIWLPGAVLIVFA